MERKAGDQQGDREPDPGNGAPAGDLRPAEGRAQPAAYSLAGDQPRRPQDPERLAHHVPEEDAERDR